MYIKYRVNARVSAEQYCELLKDVGLDRTRSLVDREAIQDLLEHSNLTATAWIAGRLVGIARAVTDFHVACYLSDLAVATEYQHKGIGTTLQALIQQQLGERCQLILLSPPEVSSYYPKLGFELNPRCWILPRNRRLNRLMSKAKA